MRLKVTIVVLLVAITVGLVGVGLYTGLNKTPTNEPQKIDCTITVMSFNVRTINFGIEKNPNDDIDLRTPLMLKQIADANADIANAIVRPPFAAFERETALSKNSAAPNANDEQPSGIEWVGALSFTFEPRAVIKMRISGNAANSHEITAAISSNSDT